MRLAAEVIVQVFEIVIQIPVVGVAYTDLGRTPPIAGLSNGVEITIVAVTVATRKGCKTGAVVVFGFITGSAGFAR